MRAGGDWQSAPAINGSLTNTLLCFDDNAKLYFTSIIREQQSQYEHQNPEKNISYFMADVYRL